MNEGLAGRSNDYEWVDGCMNGWMNRWMNVCLTIDWAVSTKFMMIQFKTWMYEHLNIGIGEWMKHEWIAGWRNELWISGWMNACMKEWMDEWVDGRIDEWIDEWIFVYQ